MMSLSLSLSSPSTASRMTNRSQTPFSPPLSVLQISKNLSDPHPTLGIRLDRSSNNNNNRHNTTKSTRPRRPHVSHQHLLILQFWPLRQRLLRDIRSNSTFSSRNCDCRDEGNNSNNDRRNNDDIFSGGDKEERTLEKAPIERSDQTFPSQFGGGSGRVNFTKASLALDDKKNLPLAIRNELLITHSKNGGRKATVTCPVYTRIVIEEGGHTLEEYT